MLRMNDIAILQKYPKKTKRKIFQVLNNLNQIFAETIIGLLL